MSESKFTPFTIHSLDPGGISIVTRAVTPFTAESILLYAGDSYEVSESVYELSKDRDGHSWLDDESTHWARGPVPDHVRDAAEAARLEALRAERDVLLQRNPELAKATAAGLRLKDINAQLAR